MDILLLQRSIRKAGHVTFSRSGGPGGQNVNKVNTKVILQINPADLEGLTEAERVQLSGQLASRLSGEGALIIHSSEERSQRINLERAYARMEAIIAASARLPKKRRPVKPSKAARERRLEAKHIHSEKKQNRQFSAEE